MKMTLPILMLLVAGLAVPPTDAAGQTPLGTAFTYQGQLRLTGTPVSGPVDFQFRLMDAVPFGNPVGPTLTFDGVGGNPAPVNLTDGLFTVPLDFGGGLFIAQACWLEVSVLYPAGAGLYTTLYPSQQLTPVPFALATPSRWTDQNPTCNNLIAGWEGNTVDPGVVGATISGGGDPSGPEINQVTGDYGTIGGGAGNVAGTFSSG